MAYDEADERALFIENIPVTSEDERSILNAARFVGHLYQADWETDTLVR